MFDKLHVLDLREFRQLSEFAYKVFEKKDIYDYLSKSDVVCNANQRMLDTPRSSKLNYVSLYRLNSDERQVGMAGLLTREMLQFHWFSIMGLARKVLPDDDELLQLRYFWTVCSVRYEE